MERTEKLWTMPDEQIKHIARTSKPLTAGGGISIGGIYFPKMYGKTLQSAR
jgi:hypothetical protein